MVERTRRTLIRTGLGVGLGAVAVIPTAVIGTELDSVVVSRTGKKIGNASFDEKVKRTCETPENLDRCYDEYQPTDASKVTTAVIAPVTEETIFRLFPSTILDITTGGITENEYGGLERKDPESIMRGGFGMTRREVIVGAASSVVFGGMHNLTRKGFTTDYVPTHATLFGGVCWYLQRKFGFLSNLTLHTVNNTLAVSEMGKKAS